MINVKLGQAAKDAKNRRDLKAKLKIRKTLDGKLLIFDHIDFDVVVDGGTMTVCSFPKDEHNDFTHDSQMKFFNFLKKRGVIIIDSIKGGNIFGSVEAKIAPSEELDSVKTVLYNISKFMELEEKYFEDVQRADSWEEHLVDPDDEETSEYDPERQAPDKGTLTTATTLIGSQGYLYHRIFEGIELEEV